MSHADTVISGRRAERVKEGHETVLRIIERLTKVYGNFSYTNNFSEKQITEQNSGSWGKPDVDAFINGKRKLVEAKGLQVFWRVSSTSYEKRGKLALTKTQWEALLEYAKKNGGEPCLIVELKTRCTQAPYLYFIISREVVDAWKTRYGEWISPSVWEIIDLGEKL